LRRTATLPNIAINARSGPFGYSAMRRTTNSPTYKTAVARQAKAIDARRRSAHKTIRPTKSKQINNGIELFDCDVKDARNETQTNNNIGIKQAKLAHNFNKEYCPDDNVKRLAKIGRETTTTGITTTTTIAQHT
jgi:hypothetical protein